MFPVIAIKGQLFEAWLDGEGIVVREIQRGQVDWSYPASGVGRVLIDVVTDRALDEYARDLRADADLMKEHGVEAAGKSCGLQGRTSGDLTSPSRR